MNPLVVDIETSGTPWDGTLLCIGAIDNHNPPSVYRGDEMPPSLRNALADPEVPLVTASTFDIWWLKLAGYEVKGPFHDIQVMAWLLDENQKFDLDSLSKKYLDRDPDKRLKKRANVIYFTMDCDCLIPLQWFADWLTGHLCDDDPPCDHCDMAEAWRQMIDYNRRDIVHTLDLYNELKDRIYRYNLEDLWLNTEVPFTEVMVNMETSGMPINLEDAAELRDKLAVERDEAEKIILDLVGYEFNVNSDPQLAEVLFSNLWAQKDRIPVHDPEMFKKAAYISECPTGNEMALAEWKVQKAIDSLAPPGFEVDKVGRSYIHGYWLRKGQGLFMPKMTPKKTRKSTSSRDLMVYCAEDKVVQAVLAYRKLDKVIGTYLDAYGRFTHDDRLYGRFRRVGTVSGRISSSEPNLMNQPSRGRLGPPIRALFQGDLIVGDHSQLEPRLMAHFSGDEVLMDVYLNNKDVYIETGSRVFGRQIEKGDDERDIAKTFFLALGYEAQAETLATTLALNGFPTPIDRAQEYLWELEKVFKGLFAWKRSVVRWARDHGYVTTIGGRIRHLRPSVGMAYWKLDRRGERQAINSIIQGSAADILQDNMLDCRKFGGIALLCQVHDELVWGIHEDCGCSGPSITDNTDFDVCLWHSRQGNWLLQKTCENPRFDLRVPLRFEPHLCDSWAGKEGTEFDFEAFLEDAV